MPMATPMPMPRDRAALDATLTAADWPLVHRLRRLGLSDEGLGALVRLRTAVQDREDLALDGFAPSPRARFARWLVAQGRLNEGA